MKTPFPEPPHHAFSSAHVIQQILPDGLEWIIVMFFISCRKQSVSDTTAHSSLSEARRNEKCITTVKQTGAECTEKQSRQQGKFDRAVCLRQLGERSELTAHSS
ncbi:hypothetical protein Q8A67_018982 [Cirrhinus molitorella]|uniref:Uncharacterized protein n=1 Tax=Cirrhinus molitorella TaxID=172907 RepID=A0AA88TJI2_9TELE|nr:hypothetical protein Q8A67_018982 [Cirrhinus molitorella]